MYSNKDLLLLDDPISALDSNVKKKIFKHVIMGELRDKTRILVTHAIDFLHLSDKIIVMKKGRIVLDGTFESLKDNDYLIKILKIH